jgi:RNA polymerase sigma-70 factor (ECF subfamily)
MTLSSDGPTQSLLHRLADGDRGALAELYDRAVPLVFPLALRITGDSTAAEAVVEEAFAEMWRDRRASAGRTTAGIVPLAARCRALALSQRAGTLAPRAAVWPGSDSAAAERVLGMSEDDRYAAAARVLLGLSPAEQRVIERAYFEGSFLADIADDMGVDSGEARRLLRSALIALRAEIDGADSIA